MFRPLKKEDIPPIKSDCETLHIPIVYRGKLRFVRKLSIIAEQVLLEPEGLQVVDFWKEYCEQHNNYYESNKNHPDPPGDYALISECEYITDYKGYKMVLDRLTGQDEIVELDAFIKQRNEGDRIMAMSMMIQAQQQQMQNQLGISAAKINNDAKTANKK